MTILNALHLKKKKNKKFDCVRMMRDIRDKISSDIKNMSPEQILEYIKKDSMIMRK